MKAIVVREFGGPERLKLEETPAPRPGAGQALVKVKAAGVNPLDAYLRSGSYSRKPELPYVPGGDAAGIVEEAGPNCPFAPGRRVYLVGALPGSYAQKAVGGPGQIFALPDALSFEQGAALGVPYGTAHRALFHHGRAQTGETVLIHGASGGVGTAAVQLAQGAGLTVIGTAGGPEGAAFLRSLGVSRALDHRRPGYLDEAVALTGGRGPELILEILANVNLPADLRIAAPRGRIVIVGSRGRVEIDPRAAMSKDLVVSGMSLFNLSAAERAEIYAALGRELAEGRLAPVIARRFPLAEAAAAHAAVLEPGARGKIVLLP